MSNSWTNILGDKRGWKAMGARANPLPRDHRADYGDMKSSMWQLEG